MMNKQEIRPRLSFRNMSSLITLFGLVLLCFIWIILLFKVQSERQLAIEDAIKETGNFARAFEEHTVRTIKSADQAALFLKFQYENEGRNMNIPQYISEGRLSNQPFVLLSVIDETGDLVVSSQVPFIPSNLNDREHFVVHKYEDSGQLFISKPILGRSSGKWSIQMTRRINKPDGSFGGVVVVSVDPTYFTDFYKQVDMGKNSTVTLIGKDGIVRLRQTGEDNSTGYDLSVLMSSDEVKNSTQGTYTVTSPIDGITRIHSYRVLKDYPFVISVGIEESEVLDGANHRILVYFWVAVTVTIVVVAFSLILLETTRKQKRVEEELYQAHERLEFKVKQRTKALFKANEELAAMNEEQIAMNSELQFINLELQNEIADRQRIQDRLNASKEELTRKNNELIEALATIERTQSHLIQQEKLAGIGQLAAGVAHEINNPLGFVTGNIEMLEKYITVFKDLIREYQAIHRELELNELYPLKSRLERMEKYEMECDLEYILEDLPDLMQDTVAGLERIANIVKGMRHFARIDNQHLFETYDLVNGLENTLVIAHNEIKHYADVKKHYMNVPLIEAVGGEINQVLLNLIVNAKQAIKEKDLPELGIIGLSTWHDTKFVYFQIEDNGIGIESENLKNIFNPFYTTKPVGEGTGMGLNISYDIIVNKHKGEISVKSESGIGTKFTIKLPITQTTSTIHDFES